MSDFSTFRFDTSPEFDAFRFEAEGSVSHHFAQKPTPKATPSPSRGIPTSSLAGLSELPTSMNDLLDKKRRALQEELAAHELLVTQLKLLGMEDMEDYTEHLSAVARCYFQLKMMNAQGTMSVHAGYSS
ncbi:MAG: hypothetical protein ACKO37_02885 [Vampirovibrionales bacterium]